MIPASEQVRGDGGEKKTETQARLLSIHLHVCLKQ